ncbi:hypothetical protein MKZ38_000271 [Zalerion maritima]|uniref:Uncharacterized protein n=1 Tax=Zalerion maritima TaxID=339359 RepID=A0AAD5RRQ6_9PEZI|nr:hypothetical protein MKZ38_000271 [Zalerion maritima]
MPPLYPNPNMDRACFLTKFLSFSSISLIVKSDSKKKKFLASGQKDSLFRIECNILANWVQNLFLGSWFLRHTKTLGRFTLRFKTLPSNILRRGPLSLNFVGIGQECLSGWFNDDAVLAVPNYGSSAMFISSKRTVEFADGSRGQTIGVMKNVEWRFRDDELLVKCDFFVSENLPLEVVLSNPSLTSWTFVSDYPDLLKMPEGKNKIHNWELFGINFLGSLQKASDKMFKTWKTCDKENRKTYDKRNNGVDPEQATGIQLWRFARLATNKTTK